MRLLHRPLAVLGLLASSSCAQNIVSFPTNVEIDVVFPRNDTYAPAEVFPVVFVLQGATAAWNFGFSFEWSISYADGYAGGGLVGFGYTSADGDSPPPSDPFVVTNRSIALPKSSEEHKYELRWEFGFYTNCTDNGDTFEIESVPFNVAGTLIFTIKAGEKTPDIAEPGKCPMLGSLLGLAGNSTGGCVHIGDSGIQANPCAFTVDAALASSVTAQIGTAAPTLTFATTNPTGTTTWAPGAAMTNAAGRLDGGLAAALGLAALLV